MSTSPPPAAAAANDTTGLAAAARALYMVATTASTAAGGSTAATSDGAPPTTASQRLRERYGRGVFYACFDTPAETGQFAAAPALDARVWYCDEERCLALRLPDTTVGALAANRAPAIVVVDQFKPGARCFSDSDGALHTQVCQLARLEMGGTRPATPPSAGTTPEPVSDTVCDWVEQQVRAQPPARQRGTVYYVELADDDACPDPDRPPLQVECVSPNDVQQLIDGLKPVLGDVAASVQLLQRLSRECPDQAAVVWLRSARAGRVDMAWTVALQPGSVEGGATGPGQ